MGRKEGSRKRSDARSAVGRESTKLSPALVQPAAMLYERSFPELASKRGLTDSAGCTKTGDAFNLAIHHYPWLRGLHRYGSLLLHPKQHRPMCGRSLPSFRNFSSHSGFVARSVANRSIHARLAALLKGVWCPSVRRAFFCPATDHWQLSNYFSDGPPIISACRLPAQIIVNSGKKVQNVSHQSIKEVRIVNAILRLLLQIKELALSSEHFMDCLVLQARSVFESVLQSILLNLLTQPIIVLPLAKSTDKISTLCQSSRTRAKIGNITPTKQ